MNFLALCNEVKNQGSSGGPDMTSVVGQNGVNARIVRWVNQSYQEIINHRDDWQWKKVLGFTFATSASKRNYPVAELSLTNVGKWDLRNPRIYNTASGVASEVLLKSIYYEDWENLYAVGTQVEGQPQYIFVEPGTNTLLLHPVPDTTYTVTLNYWKTAPNMVADSDTPILPTEYHDIIIYKALMKYAVYEDANEVFADSLRQYAGMLERMEETELEEITFKYRRFV
jgi:hypothetical protein